MEPRGHEDSPGGIFQAGVPLFLAEPPPMIPFAPFRPPRGASPAEKNRVSNRTNSRISICSPMHPASQYAAASSEELA
jgi:hypothetical protein